jgi:hypothetical protein
VNTLGTWRKVAHPITHLIEIKYCSGVELRTSCRSANIAQKFISSLLLSFGTLTRTQ